MSGRRAATTVGALRFGRRNATLIALTAGAVVLHLLVARDVTLPHDGPGDQWAYLGNARWLAGVEPTLELPHFPFFSIGYSLVLAPAVRLFSDDPLLLYATVKVTNALLMASLVPLLYLFARHVLGATRAASTTAAAVGAVVPAAVINPSHVVAENLVLPASVGAVLCCWAFLTERPTPQRFLFGPAVVLLYATHQRFLLVIPVMALLVATATRLGVVPPRVAAVNAAASIGLLAATVVTMRRLVAARWVEGVETPQGSIAGVGELLTSPAEVGELLLVAAGQAWYLVVGTLGLAVLGWWSLGWRLRGAHQAAVRTAGGRLAGLAELARDARSLTLGFLLTSALAVFLASSYFFLRVWNSSEGFVAGRHNESFVPLWVTAGVVYLVARPPGRQLVAALVTILATGASLTATLIAGRSRSDLDGLYSPFNVPAIARFGDQGRQAIPLLPAGVLLVAVTVLVVGTALRRPLPVVVAASAWMVVTSAQVVEPEPGRLEWDVPDLFAAIAPGQVAVVQGRDRGMPLAYPFLLPGLRPLRWGGTGAPPVPYVLAELGDPRLEGKGGRVALVDHPVGLSFAPYSLALWVLPGVEHDDLAQQGRLLPPGFPAALPARAAQVDLVLDPDMHDEPPIHVGSGERVDIVVLGRHTGQGAPWPDVRNVSSHWVRIGARSVGGDRGDLPTPGDASVDLPRWIVPGETFRVDLPVDAIDADGRPLPPGRYLLGLDLEQAGVGWFAEPGAESLHLELHVE